ncbi:hypothetical protein ACFQX6_03110 [Streptosporangium lutulentum]
MGRTAAVADLVIGGDLRHAAGEVAGELALGGAGRAEQQAVRPVSMQDIRARTVPVRSR